MPEVGRGRYLIQAGWDDVPHLDPEMKARLLANMQPHLREARTKGIPSLGSGAIYPKAPEEIWVEPFQIPDFWPRAFALDVGWNRTACLWAAWNPSDGVCYPYQEYYAGRAVPAVHSEAIKVRGRWIPGVIDPASRGRSQHDGAQLFQTYKDLGLRLTPADNSVEAGLHAIWNKLNLGLMRPFSTLQNFWNEYRIYRRDEHGKIVKQHDHLMDCWRYIENSGRAVAITRPVRAGESGPSTFAADTVTGY